VALVRPTGIEGMSPKSVKKKMKQPSFAAAVSRDDMRLGAEEMGEDFDQHLAFVIAALEPRAAELGLTGGAAGGQATVGNDGVSGPTGNVAGEA
jgi:predicted hydrolase (HD superfamily)